MNSELAMDSPTPPASPLLSQPLDLLDQQEHIVGMDTVQNSNKLVNSYEKETSGIHIHFKFH